MHLKWLIFILFSVLLFPAAVADNPPPPFWWAIELQVSIQGNYRFAEGNMPITGEYRYRILWKGSMERDNGDYILYQGIAKLLSLRWDETQEGRSRDMSNLVKPEIAFNYVVRKGKKVHVDFNIKPGSKNTPGGHPWPDIIFPQSTEHEVIEPAIKYNRGVHHGSNEVAVVEEQLYNLTETGGRFNWEWRLDGLARKHHHAVLVEFRLFRKSKE